MVAVNIKAYSLLESIVAMVLIMLVAAASLLVLSGQLRGHQIQLLNESNVLINTIHHYAISESNFSDESIDMDYITIEKQVEPYEQSDDTFVFRYTAYNLTEKEILTKKFIVRHEEEPR